MVQIKGTGFSDIKSSDKKTAKVYYGGPEAEARRKLSEEVKQMMRDFGGSPASDKFNPKGTGMGDRFDPTASNYFSPGGGAFQETKVASTDLSGIDFGAKDFAQNFAKGVNTDSSEEKKNFFDGQKLADNTYKSTFESDVSPDYTDTYKETLKNLGVDTTVETDKPFTTGSGDTYTSNPYTSIKDDFSEPNNAKLLRRKGDDPNFSQRYSTEGGKEDFIKERNAYLQSIGRPIPSDPNVKKTMEGPVDFVKSFFGFSKNYQNPDGKAYLSATNQFASDDYQQYRKDLRDKAFAESSLGDAEKNYYYKDFQKPGVFRTENELNSYLKDRGAFITKMPSNFEGGVSGLGKKTDDFSKDERYQSTGGLKTDKLEVKQPNVLDRTMNFIGNVTNKALGIQDAGASQLGPVNVKTQTTTAPVGGYTISPEGKVKALQNRIEAGIKATNIPNNTAVQGGAMSQEARDQALQNRINAGIASTGIPNNTAVQGGVTTQEARDAGIKARQERAATIKMRNDRVQGIVNRNPRLTRSADGSVKAVQQTRAEAGVSARTAQGNRARVKANTKARAQARKNKKKK